MRLPTRLIAISSVGILAVGFLIFTAFRQDPLPVDLAQVTRGTLAVTVDAQGETAVRDVYQISAPISGTVLRMAHSVGDAVTKGQTILAEVEPATAPLLDARSRAEAEALLTEAEASIRYAEAEVARTRADQAFAETQFTRMQALVESGTASISRLENVSLALDQAKAATLSAQARLEMAIAGRDRANATLLVPQEPAAAGACCVSIRAPIDGVILHQPNKSARPVVAGELLLTVGQTRNLEVVVDLLSADATRLTPGARATLERWGGDAPLHATLREIEPSARTVTSALGIEEQRVIARLDIRSPTQDWLSLGHSYAVFARIEEWRAEDVLLVPLSAVFKQDGFWFTFVAEDGIATRRVIEIGRRDGRMAQVLGGLAEGETVVTHPPDTIDDGVQIHPRARF